MHSIEPRDPVVVALAALAHRMNVTRLRLAQGACLTELREHLRALGEDVSGSLALVDGHPHPEAEVTIDDLGPDADFLARYG
jgi:hypothetical protein